MARAIDCEIAKKRLQAWIDESEAQGFEEAARNFRDCISLLDAVPTITPPNEPLTLEELEGFVEPTPIWWDWVCGWVLARKGMIATWDWRYHNVKELKLKGNFYRRPPEEET